MMDLDNIPDTQTEAEELEEDKRVAWRMRH